MDSSSADATTSTPAAAVRFAGKSVTIGDRSFVVPPIALGKLKELLPRLGAFNFDDPTKIDPEALDTVTELTLAALNRNYPDLTRDQLEELLDLGNLAEVIGVVTGQSGLVKSSGNGGPGSQ